MQSSPISAARRAMQVIDLLADEPEGLSVSSVGGRLQLEKSVASRLLASLEIDGYVTRDPVSDRYRLALKLLALALRHADELGFPGVCLPVLQRLAAETGELVQLAAAEGDRLYYVASVEGKQRLRIRPIIGREVIPHATASGKAWLATLPLDRAVAAALAHGMTRETPQTNTEIPALLVELEKVRAQGFATVADEWTEGISAVAAAIGLGRFSRAVGTVVMSLPTSRYDAAALEGLAPAIVAAAADLEAVWPITMRGLAAMGESEWKGGGQ